MAMEDSLVYYSVEEFSAAACKIHLIVLLDSKSVYSSCIKKIGKKTFNCNPIHVCVDTILKKGLIGLVRDLNPGPLAPKARIIPLDQQATPG